VKKSKRKLIIDGILSENPILCLMLGTCPFLAVSTTATAGVGMGIAATFVLIFSNMVISAVRKIVPDSVRIPCYITVIAGLVTICQMLVKAFVPALDEMLGIYLPLIVVNCIILGRAEMFASKNSVLDSMFDGIGMGLGFTLALLAVGSLREIFGFGTWFGYRLFPDEYAVKVITIAPGGFFFYGLAIAALAAVLAKKGKKLPINNHCTNCQGCAAGCREVETL